MKKFTKPILVVGATAAIGISALGASAIHAASSTSASNPMSGLVQAIATKFNLKTSDVQAVVDSQKAQMDVQRDADAKTRLDQAVASGKLTQAQEDLIIAKKAEQKTFMESLNGKSEADRKTAMQTNRTDLKKWATDNNIPQEYLPFGGGKGGHGGPGGFRGPQGADAPADTTASLAPTTAQ